MGIINCLKAIVSKFKRLRTRNRAYTAFSNGHGGILRPPPPPRELIEGRLKYENPPLGRVVNRMDDHPLLALYRMYQHFVLGQHLQLRYEFEAFWSHSNWAVKGIPDPKDEDPGRYECLACIPKCLVLAFNERIEFGVPRYAPVVFTSDQLEHWRSQKRQYEEIPSWVKFSPRKKRNKLEIPHWDHDQRGFVTLDRSKWHHASQECLEQGIVAYQPHILFSFKRNTTLFNRTGI